MLPPEKGKCAQIVEILTHFPHLSRIWDEKYVSKDCAQGFKQPWLNRLAESADQEILTELDRLDRYLGAISNVPGFVKLCPGIRARDLEQFASTIAEIKTAAWINGFGLLNEIRPPLPGVDEEADFKVELASQVIYGEVWMPRDLPKSWVTPSVALTTQLEEAPIRVRALRQKGAAQLPSSVIGVWVVHIYHHPLTDMAWGEFFLQGMKCRPNVLGVALWARPGPGRVLLVGGVCCTTLAGEGHRIYWLNNPACEHPYLQRYLAQKLEC